jgi:hypothetical protein
VKPNLFIVGAPKCGTTAWAEYLRQHPDVFFSDPKELHFFSTDLPSMGVTKDLHEYLNLFAESGDSKIVAEGSTRYLLSKDAARNIKDFNPAAKILIFLRNQEDSLPSLHNHLVYGGAEKIEDFEEAWKQSGIRDQSTIGRWRLGPELLDYKTCGRFHEQVERYFAVFPAEQIRVFHFDNWASEPHTTYVEIMRFLGLDDDGRSEFPRTNEARRHKIKTLGQFLHAPPKWALHVSSAMKRISGKSRLPLVDRLRALNRDKGYATDKVSPAMREEMRRYFERDNLLLHHRIWTPVAQVESDAFKASGTDHLGTK